MTNKLEITPKTEYAQFESFVNKKGKDGGVQGAMGKDGLAVYTSRKKAAQLNSKVVGQNMRVCTVSALGQELGRQALHRAISNTYGPEVADHVFAVMKQDLMAPGARIDAAMMEKVNTTIDNMFQPGVLIQSQLHQKQRAILAQIKNEANKPSADVSPPQAVSVQAAEDADAFIPPQTIGRQRAILFLAGKQDGFDGITGLDHLLLDAGWEDETIDKRAARAAVIDAFEHDAVANRGQTDNSDARNKQIALGALKQYLASLQQPQPAAHTPQTGPSGTDGSQTRSASMPAADHRFGNDPAQVLAKQRALLLLESRSEKSEKHNGLEALLIEAGWEGNSIDVRKAILAVMGAFAADDVLCDSQAQNYDAHMKDVAIQALKTFLATAPKLPAATAGGIDKPDAPPVLQNNEDNDTDVDDGDGVDDLDAEVEQLYGPGDADKVEYAASDNAGAIGKVEARLADVRDKVDSMHKTYDDVQNLVADNRRNRADRAKALMRRGRTRSVGTDKAYQARLARQAKNAKRTNGYFFAEVADRGGNDRGVPSLGAMLKAAGKKPDQRVPPEVAKKVIIEGFANYDEYDYPTLTRKQHAEKIAIPALKAYLQNVNQ